jgi:hypothetical protein
MNPSLYVGGQYSSSPLRHRSVNKETFRQLLEKQGRNLSTNALEADIYIAIDHAENDQKLLSERQKLRKFSILYRSEPSCVLPIAYEPRISALYNSMISFGKSENLSDGIHWPQYFPGVELPEWRGCDRLPRAVLINANKLNLNHSELYSLRRKSIKWIKEIDLFGENWNSKFKDRLKALAIEVMKDPFAHLSSVVSHSKYWFTRWPITESPTDKLAVMQSYKFSVVIENEVSYLSEKLFDAFFAGCIPVYVGPDVTHFNIPKELVIQCEPTVASLIEGIEIAKQTDYVKFQLKLREWLMNETTRNSHEGMRVTNRAIERTLKDYLEFTKVDQS